MKKLSFLPIILLGIYSNAQFNIKGEIKNYNNKPILVKIFPNGSEKTLKNVTTSNDGKFETKIPINYNGLIKLELPQGFKFDVISANENISFKTTLSNNKFINTEVVEGKSFKDYENLNQITPLNDLKDNFFPQLKALYSSEDSFYKAIEVEEKRITDLTKNIKINSSLVQYIQDLRSTINGAKDPNTSLQNLTTILKHVENDDDRLENSGMMTDLIYSYINTKFSNAQNASSADEYLIKVTNELLDKGNIETARGQNILSMVLNMAPEENFPKFYETFKQRYKV